MAKKLEDYMEWPRIEDLAYAEIKDPSQILGARKLRERILITGFFPDAKKVMVKPKGTKQRGTTMTQMDESGYFAAFLNVKEVPEYSFSVEYEDRKELVPDVYEADFFMDVMDGVAFGEGKWSEAYKKLGAHFGTLQGVEGVYFDVWAPNARGVSVVGDFNGWDPKVNQMKPTKFGVYELFVPGIKEGDLYKFDIYGADGKRVLKSDPYALEMEMGDHHASVVTREKEVIWKDGAWMKKREKADPLKSPMVVLEVHPESFIQEGKDQTFKELGKELVQYCKEIGYTHVEFMPLLQHNEEDAFGYNAISAFALNQELGNREDFRKMVDLLHQNEIGVILDWDASHFAKNEEGLGRFDGSCLYESEDERRSACPYYDSYYYDYGKPEVCSFKLSNAAYWLKEFHIDGLRLPFVHAMLYLDYNKSDGEWMANIYGGTENLEAEAFLKDLNSMVKEIPGTFTVAEETSAWPMVTEDVEEGGLGFTFKWNNGFVKDYVNYIQTDPLFRKGKHGELTFSMVYHYSEHFILSFSHDEFLRGSMYQKMPGTAEQKMAGLRLTYGYMMMHPGKKLIFTGQDFGEEVEPDFVKGPDRDLLTNSYTAISTEGKIVQIKSRNRLLFDYMRELIHFYKDHPALYEKDYEIEGFQWVSMLDADHSVIAFVRKSEQEKLLVVCNFTPVCYEKFVLGVDFNGKIKEILNSDNVRFGGNGKDNPRMRATKKEKWDGYERSVTFTLAPFGVQVFEIIES